jgi:hypothetical protein
MSFDFGLDDEKDRFEEVIDVESVRQYVSSKPISCRAPTPISLIRYTEKTPQEDLKSKIEEEEKKQQEIAEIEAVQSHLTWGKKVENAEDSDSDSDSDSDNEIPVAPKVTKIDLDFPTLGQAATMKVQKQNTDVSDGWLEVGKKDDRNKAKTILADKKEINKLLSKTKLCDSIKTGKTCRHGKNCRFAHSVEELVISPCVFGADCKFVVYNQGVYSNNRDKNCTHQHPEEKLEDYYVRTGLKKRAPPTEEEIRTCDPYVTDVLKNFGISLLPEYTPASDESKTDGPGL